MWSEVGCDFGGAEGLPHCTSQGDTVHVDSTGLGDRVSGAGAGAGGGGGTEEMTPGILAWVTV